MGRGYDTAKKEIPSILELMKKKGSIVGKIKNMFK
jgi:hypothetical protein